MDGFDGWDGQQTEQAASDPRLGAGHSPPLRSEEPAYPAEWDRPAKVPLTSGGQSDYLAAYAAQAWADERGELEEGGREPHECISLEEKVKHRNPPLSPESLPPSSPSPENRYRVCPVRCKSRFCPHCGEHMGIALREKLRESVVRGLKRGQFRGENGASGAIAA